MVLEEGRLSYVRQLVQSLTSDDRVNDLSEEHVHQVLEESVTQSLLELEKRFRTYTHRLQGEQDVNKWRNNVARMEGIHNERFYESQKEKSVRHIHREALRNCYSILTSDLDLFNSSLMDDLLASDVVSISDQESIKGRHTKTRQNEEFYAYLVGRLTFDEFNRIFLPALSKHHQHLADALISEVDKLEESYQESQCVACRVRKLVQLKRIATPLLMSKVIDMPLFSDLRSPGMSNNSKWAELRVAVKDCKIIDALERKYPDFHREFKTLEYSSLDCICPKQDVVDTASVPFPLNRNMSGQESDFETCFSGSTDLRDLEEEVGEVMDFQLDDLDQEYKMSANPRGICLIINITHFAKFGRRFGSDVDVQKLTATFKRLQFKVVLFNDITARKILLIMEEYSKKDHSGYDAFVCAILSHGDHEGVFGRDSNRVAISELTSLFKASRCNSLAGKPKIFILQTSRGDSRMDGVRIESEDTDDTVADEADFIIGYSAVEGYVSFRNVKSGSHYINALTNVLDTQADQHDLLECLTMTNREVARVTMKIGREYVTGRKQVPAPLFTLTKKVHLTSDPLWPHAADD